MPIFRIVKIYQDLCGNSDAYHMGYCEFDDLDQANQVFVNDKFIIETIVQPLKIEDAQIIKERIKNHKER